MTGTAILNMLFGATLVAIGVIAAALADRIRGVRLVRERPTAGTRATTPARAADVVAPESERVKPERARVPRSEEKMGQMADDVIAALVAAGYKKPIAAEATWGCSVAERATVEIWAAAALRRSARGGMS